MEPDPRKRSRHGVMEPYLVEPPPAPDHTAGFLAALRRACTAARD